LSKGVHNKERKRVFRLRGFFLQSIDQQHSFISTFLLTLVRAQIIPEKELDSSYTEKGKGMAETH